jgi:eukaryotic-like serine/threonine-protein kinase
MSGKVEVLSGLSMPFTPGTLVAGKYRIERPIGEGAMGYVVLARHVQLDQPVALKFMHAWRASQNPAGVARFLGEARAAARIRSDHVARVSDTGTLEDGSPYLVMEYLEGQDLEDMLQERRLLPIPLAVAYAMQASEGLGEAHAAGIVHRDLKPSNLFLARQTDGSVRIKLLDFGISRMAPVVGAVNGVTPPAGETTATLYGSPLYMSPEQMRASNNADQRADIWALGVVLYEMLGASPPFVAATFPELRARVFDEPPVPLRTLRGDVPPVLEAAVMQCLEKDPRRRFQSVAALARALAPFGTPETRAAAERIDRIVHRGEHRPEDPAKEPTSLAAVPQRSLTKTSFNKAVDRVAGLMLGAAVEEPAIDALPAPVSVQLTHTKASFNRAARTPLLARMRWGPLVVVFAGLVGGWAILASRAMSPKKGTNFAETRADVPPAMPMAVTAPMPSATTTVAATVLPKAALPRPVVATPMPAPPKPRSETGPAMGKSTTAPIGTSGFGGRE